MGLKALKEGFLNGCSPFLGFDGCHLKGPWGGFILAAVGLDGNNGLYPIAFAVVESECKESWGFFFRCLEEMLGGFNDDKPWTFMTDRQKGLIEAISEIAPNATNRKCCRHIYANFRKQFAGVLLKKYFWMAARSYNIQGFSCAMEKIKEIKPAAYDWLMKIHVHLWAGHGFDVRLKNNHVTNNLSESFNHWIGDVRSKPILTLLDGIRTKLMNNMRKRYEKGLRWTNLICANVVSKLNIAKGDSMGCDLMEWDISGIPCKHAALGIAYRRESLELYVDVSFYTARYLNAYGEIIHPIPNPAFWPTNMNLHPISLLPPKMKNLPGRPKKSRRKEPGEATTRFKRSSTIKCGGFGHNKRTCSGLSTQISHGKKKPEMVENVVSNASDVENIRNIKRKRKIRVEETSKISTVIQEHHADEEI